MPPVEPSHTFDDDTPWRFLSFSPIYFTLCFGKWKEKKNYHSPNPQVIFCFCFRLELVITFRLFTLFGWKLVDANFLFQRSNWLRWNIALKLDFRFFYYFSGGSAYLLWTNTSKQLRMSTIDYYSVKWRYVRGVEPFFRVAFASRHSMCMCYAFVIWIWTECLELRRSSVYEEKKHGFLGIPKIVY